MGAKSKQQMGNGGLSPLAEWTIAVMLGLAGVAYAQPVSPDAKGAQAASAQAPGAQAPTAQPVQTAPATPPKQTADIPATSVTPHREWAEIAARLTAVDAAVSKLAEKKEALDYVPGLITALVGVASSLLGVFVGGFFTYRNQRRLADQQWQLRQLAELYGPLRALLRQSHAVYRHMNAVLEKTDPAKFRLRVGGPGVDFDDKISEINLGGHWVLFRTIVHIDEVYGRGYGVEEYFDEVVAIGGRLVTVIEQKAGLARPDQPELPVVFGRYLAHYSVLRMLHGQKKAVHLGTSGPSNSAGQPPRPQISVMEAAAFPIEIQGLVDKGFEAVTKDLKA
jgi:hypothetical protein